MSPELLFFVAISFFALGLLMWLDERDMEATDAYKRNHVRRPRKDR